MRRNLFLRDVSAPISKTGKLEQLGLLMRNTYEEEDERRRLMQLDLVLREKHSVGIVWDQVTKIVGEIRAPTTMHEIPKNVDEIENTLASLGGRIIRVDNDHDANVWVAIPRLSFYSYEDQALFWFAFAAVGYGVKMWYGL